MQVLEWRDQVPKFDEEMLEYVRLAKVERETLAASLTSKNSNLLSSLPAKQESDLIRSEKISGLVSMLLSKIQEGEESVSDDVKLITLKLLGPKIEMS